MTNHSRHPFDRSGIAALSDLKSEPWRAIYSLLEKEQAEFLVHEDRFRSPEYKWPRDPLHSWSRVWEYPYAYHHLSRWCAERREERLPHVVDFGSGVTFFPFSVARLGCRVTCVDIDPLVGVDLPRAASVVHHRPGRVDWRLSDRSRLPFADGEVDAVYCLSVLEHIPDCEDVIAELGRILRPRGMLILTIDLDRRGDKAIGVDCYHRMMEPLLDLFDYQAPVATVHPLDVLSTDAGPFPLPRLHPAVFVLREGLRRLRGRPRGFRIPFHLTIEGSVLSKR